MNSNISFLCNLEIKQEVEFDFTKKFLSLVFYSKHLLKEVVKEEEWAKIYNNISLVQSLVWPGADVRDVEDAVLLSLLL